MGKRAVVAEGAEEVGEGGGGGDRAGGAESAAIHRDDAAAGTAGNSKHKLQGCGRAVGKLKSVSWD